MNWNVYLESSPPRGILEVLGAVVMILMLVFLTRRIQRTIQRRAMWKLLLGNAEAWNKWRQEHPEKRPDFRGANLRGADLRDVDLHWANLNGADLSGANLRGANLGGANLGGANLKWADLIRANLRGADLRGANLWAGRFYFADLSNADLLGAKWVWMEISKANIWGIKARPDGFKEWALKHAAVEVEPGTDVF